MRDKSNQKRAFLSGTEDDFPDGGVEGAARLSCKILGLACDRWLRAGGFRKMENEYVRDSLWVGDGFVGRYAPRRCSPCLTARIRAMGASQA